MIYLESSGSHGEVNKRNMSDGAKVSSGVKTFDCEVLHEDGEKAK